MNMFSIESYITPILLSYVDKYVRDFKPADAQVSLWGGGVTLHNLVLKADVLQQEVALPFTLVSGRIHELLIQVPWTKIMSEPIVVTINTIECVLSLNPPPDDVPPQETTRAQVVQAPPGYMQALVRRIVSNIAVRVNSLIVKYVHDDVILSLNVKRLAIESVGPNWEPIFADIDQNNPAIRRLVRLDDLTLCLDKSDSDGKVRFYNEPLIYRCQLEFRVLTRLVSANTRRARSVSIQLISSRLAWGVNNEQLILLMRLLRERNAAEEKTPPPVPNQTNVQPSPLPASTSNSAEPAEGESWSQWAWSWLPTWIDREGFDEIPTPATPLLLACTAYFDQISLVFKTVEIDVTGRRRSRGIGELTATDAVIKICICSPTYIHVKIGSRNLTLASNGRCVCGNLDNVNNEKPTIYLEKIVDPNQKPWSWIEEKLSDQAIETAMAADEDLREMGEVLLFNDETFDELKDEAEAQEEIDKFWQKMAPVVYFEYSHDRSTSNNLINPYENTIRDFEYSDWEENCTMTFKMRPMQVNVTVGLLHRLTLVRNVLKEVPSVAAIETPVRTLTVEECDALAENLPVRHTNVEIKGLRIRILPSDHSERPIDSPLVLELRISKINAEVSEPLYPNRVCSAACQMPEDSGTLWENSHRNLTVYINSFRVGISSPDEDISKFCAKVDFKLIAHILLNQKLFTNRESIYLNNTFKMRDLNICGSAARLRAAYQVIDSVIKERITNPLRLTTLAQDALNDEELVALEFTLEHMTLRGFFTKHNNTLFVSVTAVKVIAKQTAPNGERKEAWIFSGPESPSIISYIRTAFQWCNEPLPSMIEYVNLKAEPTAFSIDALLVSWLSYQPRLKKTPDPPPQSSNVKSTPSSQHLFKRKGTPPSSCGRGGSRTGSGTELVHVRPRSLESESEPSQKKDDKPPSQTPQPEESWYSNENLLKLYERLNRLLITADVGLTQIYIPSATVSAVGVITLREAIERHTSYDRRVVVMSFGRFSVCSSPQMNYLWKNIKSDQPTFFRPQRLRNLMEDSFPWKIRLADMYCYTLEVKAGREQTDKEFLESGLKSHLKMSRVVLPRPVLDMFTNTITLSVVTKCLPIRNIVKTSTNETPTEHSREEDQTKYFKTGADFNPNSLQEFIRGPVRRENPGPEAELKSSVPPLQYQTAFIKGPVVSLGVNLHADTPPIVFKMNHDQMQIMSVAIHGVVDIINILKRPSMTPQQECPSSASHSTPKDARTASDVDAGQSASEETTSADRSEQLISIFESQRDPNEDTKLRTFFFFQWVISHVSLVATLPEVRLAFDIDDIIISVDLHNHYDQLKVKVASASVYHYKRTDAAREWTPGLLGGRILEVREPSNSKVENNFLAVTITQAQISNLPPSWREELHPKFFEQSENSDTMWEIYATLAPLEMSMQPDLLEHIMFWVKELTPENYCSVKHEKPSSPRPWQWPFFYLTSGGLRLVLTHGEENENAVEDTLMIIIDQIRITPYPENPICRQSVNPTADAWNNVSCPIIEERQYELMIKDFSVRTTRFSQLVNEEATELEKLSGTGGGNPALKWSQPVVASTVIPVVHSMDISCILAPTVYSSGVITHGPAIEFNLPTDCSIELAVEQLDLLSTLTTRFLDAATARATSSHFSEDARTCPYAPFISYEKPTDSSRSSETSVSEEVTKGAADAHRGMVNDSGFETSTCQSHYKSGPGKKSVSISCYDQTAKASDYLEVFVTMGVIDISLYVGDNGSPEVTELRPPPGVYKKPIVEEEPRLKVKIEEGHETKTEQSKDEGNDSLSGKSLTEDIRNADIGTTKFKSIVLPYARKSEGNIPLIHATLKQPNFYYLKRKKHKIVQISLFDAWLGLGVGQEDGFWNAPLFSTARGISDPITEIPPALATLRLELYPGAFVSRNTTSSRGTAKMDVERPILLEVCSDRIRRIKGIENLIKTNISKETSHVGNRKEKNKPGPLLFELRRNMVHRQIESVIVQTGQIGLRGPEGTIGWSSIKLQALAGMRPDRLKIRGIVTAFVLCAGPSTDRRHVVLQPVVAGILLDATWEAWRKAEGGLAARDPTIRMSMDVDRISLDVRPCDIVSMIKIRDAAHKTLGWLKSPATPASASTSRSDRTRERPNVSTGSSKYNHRWTSDGDLNHHYYKDDLRSGAFKFISGRQLPMAYQVTLQDSTVAWRYPHPRAITRIVAYPLPGQEEEVECVLELYCSMQSAWEPHTYFNIPIVDPRVIKFSAATSDAIFSQIWRVRICTDKDRDQTNVFFEFDPNKFTPRPDLLSAESVSEYYTQRCSVSAEQLAGVLRIDSYFAPRNMPRVRIAIRVVALEIYAHNGLLELPRHSSSLEGYYVSKPLMRSHRVISFNMRNSRAHFVHGALSRIILDTYLSSDILNSATGSMDQLMEEFQAQGMVSLNKEQSMYLRAGDIRAALDIPKIYTLRSLIDDWHTVYKSFKKDNIDTKPSIKVKETNPAVALQGRVSLWIHNRTSSTLRVSQENTDELLPLSGGASLAYRWRSSTSPKNLRFSIGGPLVDWCWSNSIPFSVGKYRILLEEDNISKSSGKIYLYVRVKDVGIRRDMYLAGRITLANMLQQKLLFMVRAKYPHETILQTISSGELNAESIANSVLCYSEYDTTLKLKFTTAEGGWTGDIPLKECRKENMPWLVKVPAIADASYMSIWLRVNRARTDSRIIATVWPFYILRSHMPLDADVSVLSQTHAVTTQGIQLLIDESVPTLVQTAFGRGSSIQLKTPGTTATTHALTFQYRNIACPVTRQAVPLYYGVTENSVFEKLKPIATIEEITDALKKWLKQYGREAHSGWPYSIVTGHWPGTWQPALTQPGCDVTMRYKPIRIGGGCSLELQLCPLVLLANASTISLTLRAHDATPLCRLDPGMAVSPPTGVLQAPFFLSVELGRETFVSGQLQVCHVDPGLYGTPPPGHIVFERASNFAIHCNQKVALLTICYEVKEDMNLLGITSTYMLINRLPTAILMSAVAVPNHLDKNSILRPNQFKVVEPTEEDSIHGTPLCRFWMRGRWRGGYAEELRTYLCIALPSNSNPTVTHVPIRLGTPPLRRAIALRNGNGHFMAVVVTQMYHDSRWVITVAEDPCPQFVVHNRTTKKLAVGQPTSNDPVQATILPVRECIGVRWWCELEAGAKTYYSTPAFCNRYPPLDKPALSVIPPVPFLTIGQLYRGEYYYAWSQPVAIADGVQLLQMSGGKTIKVRVRTHPHSTLVELQDVDQNDISASDVRRRLLGAMSDGSASLQSNVNSNSKRDVHRKGAHDKHKQSYARPGPSTAKDHHITSPSAAIQTDVQSTSETVQKAENTPPSTSGAPPTDSSTLNISTDDQNDIEELYKRPSVMAVAPSDISTDYSEDSQLFDVKEKDWSCSSQIWKVTERFRCSISSVSLTIGASSDILPLIAIHLQRAAILLRSDTRKLHTTISVAEIQIDNAQYETDLYDFAVVLTSPAVTGAPERWPPLWGMYNEVVSPNFPKGRVLLNICHDNWTVNNCRFQELTEIELKMGPLGLYIEDAYITALIDLLQLAMPTPPPTAEIVAIAESRSLQCPLRLRTLNIHQLNLTLTLHTATRMYIALDESPLHLNQFHLQDMMTSSAILTHALTVHYLSAAILGAGWVVGGLELLGAPGALAARVVNAGGGVRGVASAAAGALLKSLSAAAGSFARNLDLLAGDEDHARRAAAARRRPPSSLMAGLVAGIKNFAINILADVTNTGAVGGLAHHPIVGPAVGESCSGAAGLRRGLLGAITKPLSATADLVAYAGHGLLSQTGWDDAPQPRHCGVLLANQEYRSRWRSQCVRWTFRLSEMTAIAGFDVSLKNLHIHVLITHECLVLVEPESECIVEMIDFKMCSLSPYKGHGIELHVEPNKPIVESEEENEYLINIATMSRVARYAGAEGFIFNHGRKLTLQSQPGLSHTLYATLSAVLQHNNESHFQLL